jgi:hypothetical protein
VTGKEIDDEAFLAFSSVVNQPWKIDLALMDLK